MGTQEGYQSMRTIFFGILLAVSERFIVRIHAKIAEGQALTP